MKNIGTDTKRQPYKAPTWAFAGGKWEKIDDPLDCYGDGETTSLDELLREAGYRQSNGFDEGEWNGATIREAETKTELTSRFRFLVTIEISYDGPNDIFVTDLPDLLELLPAIAAWRSMVQIEGFAAEITKTAERAFRAWHGHDSHFACTDCDPGHMERLTAARASRKAAVQ